MKLSDGSGEVYYDAIALTGFLSKELNFADTDPFSKIYEKVSLYIYFIILLPYLLRSLNQYIIYV